MNMDAVHVSESTLPVFLEQSGKLIQKLRTFSSPELMEFMDISEKLAELNRQRFQDWELPFTPDNSKPALLTFTGDVYDGLEADSLSKPQIRFAQKNLRILSGLYGLLRPLDLIQPYRLEMGRPLAMLQTKNLYEFWRAGVTDALNQLPGERVVNLASQEYFKTIDKRKLDKQIISPVFKDEKNGQFKIISFYAKKARGTMARYLIKNSITDADGLCSFAEDGYIYCEALSSPAAPVFTRGEKS